MDTKKINLFVYDTKVNFEKSKQFIGEEGSAFKKIICIENAAELDLYFETNLLDDNDYVYLVVHVFAFEKIKGIKKYKTSGIPEKYRHLGEMYISDGVESDINHKMVEEKITPHPPIYKYHEIFSNLRDDKYIAYTKKQIKEFANEKSPEFPGLPSHIENQITKCDYAIITALEEDEMEKVLPMITKIGTIPNEKHLIEYGVLKSNQKKKIAYASQQSTGMIDASILATELITLFRPKYLIMAGVLGGKPDEVNIGDVVIATRVFTTDKGKINELGYHSELETTTNEGTHITSLRRIKKSIVEYLRKEDSTRDSKINLHFGSIACLRQVISLEGYFETEVSATDRKALALEMESYGVSRACELVNDGKTKALIIKAAMDNTEGKTDKAKAYAAWSSAKLIEYILTNDII